MSASRTMMAVSRPLFRPQQPFFSTTTAGLRFAGVNATRSSSKTASFSTGRTTTMRFAQRQRFGGGQQQKRWSSTTGETEAQAQGWFKRMWDSPIGFKTVHFWAPVLKWAIVIAGISDFARPAEKLSATQNFALTCTGLIWTRWCLIIKPKNYLLAAVNFFLGCVGLGQLARIAAYERSKKSSMVEKAGDLKEEAKAEVKATVDQIKN